MMQNPLTLILYQLYLLQLEEYNVERFIDVVRRTRGNVPTSWRSSVKWTSKMMLVAAASTALYIGIPLFVIYKILSLSALSFLVLLAWLIILAPFYYHFVRLALALLQPIDTYIKNQIIERAKARLSRYPTVKIIGIAGSYGKTTMKEVLASVLSEKFKVLKTTKNINTPIGISRQILKELNDSHDIYIVEMGEYYRGDIEAICKITPPDIGIITGINEAHLEKMGSIEATINTIFEIAVNKKEEGIVVVNNDSERVKENWKKYIDEKYVTTYSSKDAKLTEFREDGSGMTVEIEGMKNVNVSLLGEYVLGDISAAYFIAKKLGMTNEEIKKGIEKLKPVEHRLQPIYNANTDVMVIDDSYNGNPDGVEEAIKVLKKFKKRRKLYMTPGLVESADLAEEIHYNIGKSLSDVADIVILIKTSVTPHIAEGLTKNGFKEENIVWFDTAQEAHNGLSTLLKKGDVIMFQNDWPDNYL